MCVAIQNIMHYCESAGKEVGRYEGRQEGLSEGLSEGRQEGRREGLSEGICAMILDNLEEGVEKPRILQKLERHFALSSEEAEKYFEQVGKNTVSH